MAPITFSLTIMGKPPSMGRVPGSLRTGVRLCVTRASASALLGRVQVTAVRAFWMATSILASYVLSKRWRESKCPPSSTMTMTTCHVFVTASSSAVAVSDGHAVHC